MVLVALLASGQVAQGFGPVGRSVASEAAAVRLLSDAIVRAVRDLADDQKPLPAAVPVRQDKADEFLRIARAPRVVPDSGPIAIARLGWHVLDRPPPIG